VDGHAPPRTLIADTPAPIPGGESLARCAICGAGMLPRCTSHRYCGPACARRAKYAAPSRAIGDARRSARFHQRHASWRYAVRALRRAGVDPATVPALAELRGRGHVEGWRELVGLPAEARGRRAVAPAPKPSRAPWGAATGVQPEHVAWGLALDGIAPRTPARLVHGLVSRLIAVDHAQVARWALALPTGASGRCGWGVVLFRRDDAERLAGHVERARLGAVEIDLRIGPVVRLRAPAPLLPGRYRVTLDALTPVSHMIAGRTRPVTSPSADTILRCSGDLLQRLGLSTGRLHVASVDCETTVEHVQLGGHVGPIAGWVGRVVVECNAPAAWALSLARHAGLGGRVAYGLGRVRVEVQRA
jgi:hypothetical protein